MHADALAAEAAEAADDGRVLAELAVAGERREILDQAGDVVERNAAAPDGGRPGSSARASAWHRVLGALRGLRLEPADLLADGDRVAGLGSARNSSTLASSSATGFSKSR